MPKIPALIRKRLRLAWWVLVFRTMKATFSSLAERQTVRIDRINSRVSVRVREWKSGQQTESVNDVLVDGYCYTPAVGGAWLFNNLPAIVSLVAGRRESHLGFGRWQ